MRTIGELEDRGCEAAGYRLSGDLVEHICCRHLYGQDRMLIAWPAKDYAIVILVAPHDRSGGDVYGQLLDALELTVTAEEREKPPCCDEKGRPPTDSDVATQIADAVERRVRTRRAR